MYILLWVHLLILDKRKAGVIRIPVDHQVCMCYLHQNQLRYLLITDEWAPVLIVHARSSEVIISVPDLLVLIKILEPLG